jgi:hypothetical protein
MECNVPRRKNKIARIPLGMVPENPRADLLVFRGVE